MATLKFGPDRRGNWKIPVEPALLRMKKVSWGVWKPKQVFGSNKVIFLPSNLRVD